MNDTLQYLPQEEGRIRFNLDSSRFEFDYFIKDHLGNVRMMLTEANKTNAYPAATMETALSSVEESLYYNLNTTRSDKPSGYPTDTSYSNPNLKLAKVNGNGNKIGPAIVLKVMAGDKFNLRVSSWYKLNGVSPGTPQDPITALITALNGGVGALAGAKATTGELMSTNILNGPAQSFLNSQSGYTTSKPKAFVNWILFDEQFKYVSSSSGFEQVGTDQEFKVHQFSSQDISKNGYLYVYVSNETPNVDVYFDNLQVTHVRGPVLEETHYYPFGLTMAGISSKAVENAKPGNKMKYNGKEEQKEEFGDGSGLEWMDYGARMYCAQIGKWNGIDKSAQNYVNQSPYHYAGNNPVMFVDFDGNDYGVDVDRKNNTITIRANYLVSSTNARAFNTHGRDKFNAESGKHVFVNGSIKDLKKGKAQGYTINFAITSQIMDGGNLAFSDGKIDPNNTTRTQAADNDESGTANSVETTGDRGETLGSTGDNRVSVVKKEINSSVTTHEVAHSLGIGHFDQNGTMAPTGGLDKINSANINEILNGVGIGGSTIERNNENATGDGTLLNGSTNSGLEKGKVISMRKYNRIMRRLNKTESSND